MSAKFESPRPRAYGRTLVLIFLVLFIFPIAARLIFLVLFIYPIAARAALYAYDNGPRSWRDADWSSTGSLPAASEYRPARVLVLSGKTGGWKGVFAVHSWIVFKGENASEWIRYDVVGWGNPLRINGWAPDGRWFGHRPRVVADIAGAPAQALIPKIEATIAGYPFRHAGDYRMWPGPNSNTFVATVLRAAPEIGASLPPNALGRDYRAGFYAGPSDSRTGFELSLFGLLGLKIGWVEGIEINFLGLVAGLDVRHPALKVPGFGRVGFDALTV
jgi:hypothetical protein